MDQVSRQKFNWIRTTRIFLKSILVIIGIFILIFLLLQTPPVQNILRKKAVAWLETKLETKVEVGKLYVGFPQKIELSNIYVEDRNKDTLLSGGSFKANINLLKLLLNGTLDIRKVELEHITIKAGREAADSVFNYQFLVNAFSTKKNSANPKDTTEFFINIPSLVLDKVRLVYKDVPNGADMDAWINHLDTRIDRFDPARLVIDMPITNIDGMNARIYQTKPLASPRPAVKKDSASAVVPLQMDFNELNLENVTVDYRNDVSAVYSNVSVGTLHVFPEKIDFAGRNIELNDITIHDTKAALRFGRKEQAREVREKVIAEVETQAEAGWRIKINKLDLENNELAFDNDNSTRQRYGIDYAHLKATPLTIKANNLLFSTDSMYADIEKASFREQSGFVLDQLTTKFMYAHNQAYLQDLLLKTPGTELKRFAQLRYGSPEDLAKRFSSVQMNADIDNSYIQVKDILAFAPALRNQKAFSNPNATWYLNLQGNGTLRSMYIENLQFAGLKDTRLDVKGSLAASNQGGALTIRKLHTTQDDIALFTGQRLSNAQVNFPETFDATGTVRGSMQNLSANLNISSTVGSANVNGRFTNLDNPVTATYSATVSTGSLDLGYIMRNPQVGRISTNMQISGTGFTPGKIDTKFKGTIASLGFNNYVYRNIAVTGTILGDNYSVNADMRDPNIDLDGLITGNFSVNPSFHFSGFVDSLKTLPLNLTTQPLVFRGKVEADVPVMNADHLEANILLTNTLFVSNEQRLPLDTVRFISSRDDSTKFMTLSSDIASGQIRGQYRYSDLGKVISTSIQPYFNMSTAAVVTDVQPYDFTFNASISNAPIIASFIPGLTSFEPIHANGRFTSGQGVTANLSSAHINYNGTDISGLQVEALTTASGLRFTGDVQRLKSAGLDLYHTRVTGTALNNKVDFNFLSDDALGKNKYYLAGILGQASPGQYTLNLHPDSLTLNYQKWSVLPGNQLTITKDNILARNFTLQRNDQRLSLDGSGELLNATFTNFQLSTITAFMRSDSLFANGSMNGTIVFRNILRQPVFTSDLTINDLSFRGDTLGNAAIKVDNTSGNRYNTNATITGRGNDISLTGSFSPLGSNDIGLDLDLAIRQMQLSTIEGALGGFLQNASGSVNGNIKIGGSINQPKINGPLNFDKASFAFSILGSQFRVDQEKIMVTENGFRFDDFIIRDTANNILLLNGYVSTSNFTNYSFDLDVNASDFKILSTKKKQGALYYGDLVITAELHIEGTELKPEVDGALTVNQGTNLTLLVPQADAGVTQREGVVEFVNMSAPENDSLFRAAYDSLNMTAFRGMNITTNIEIKKEAIFNIVIDEANGDFIEVQGEALISTGIDPSGKITMVGTYELEKGSYEITFNFLRRRFDIQKGSKVTWFNEPTGAELDVTAVYIANTSPIDLVQQQVSASTPAIRNTYLQKLPFEVRLHMTGELLQPVVKFDIVLPDDKAYGVSNDIITQVDSRLAQVRLDEGELNKQVFSLLLLNRFVGENPFSSNTPGFSASNYARQSVSKLLTEQLNRLAAGLLGGADLNFDITTADDYTTGARRSRTELNIGLTKRLLNERLSISVGNNFELEGPEGTKQKPSNIIGNIAVNYSISRDGRYMIRFYRRNEYEGIVDGYIIESGLSFIISVDYNHIRELLRRKKQKVESE